MVSTGSIYKWKKLPATLDQYYSTQPPEYLMRMFELAEPMQGIIINAQKGDFDKARGYFAEFSHQYERSAHMVPEWRGYYEQDAVEDVGDALEDASKDPSKMQALYEAMGEVGKTCADCHVDNMPPVWNRYNWKDFSTVKINTPNGMKPFAEGKMNYLDAGLVGMILSIKENDQQGAEESYNLFRAMFYNLKDTCSSCHLDEPRYYVSKDITDMVNNTGTAIQNGNLAEAGQLISTYSAKSCYNCHLVHIPAQYAKVSQK